MHNVANCCSLTEKFVEQIFTLHLTLPELSRSIIQRADDLLQHQIRFDWLLAIVNRARLIPNNNEAMRLCGG